MKSILETMENNTLSLWAIYSTLGAGILFSLYIYATSWFSQKNGFKFITKNLLLLIGWIVGIIKDNDRQYGKSCEKGRRISGLF